MKTIYEEPIEIGLPIEPEVPYVNGMLVKWWTGDKSNIVDTYLVTEGDGNLPAHDGTLSYDWSGGEA